MSILSVAERLVNGERQSDYNDPVKNFKEIADLASYTTGKKLTAADCCKVLIAVKICREAFKHKDDNLIDACGYFEILSRILAADGHHGEEGD